MSEQTTGHKYDKKDPEILSTKIHEAIDKIAASFSEAELKDKVPLILKGSTSDERINFLRASAQGANPLIDAVLNNMKEKIEKLNEMEENSGADIAWRPQTGVVNSKPIKAHYLEKNKEMLQEMIEETKTRTDELKKEIVEKRQSYQQKLEQAKKSF